MAWNRISLILKHLLLAPTIIATACSGGSTEAKCDDDICLTDASLASSDGGLEGSDAALPGKSAQIRIELEPPLYQGQSADMLIRGGFVEEPDPNCTPIAAGGCVIEDCAQFDGATYAAPGRLTFSPALNGNISFDPGPFRIFFSGDFLPWAADETFSISSEGDDVPAFSISVASPQTLDIGADRELFNLPLPKSESLQATWLPISERVLLRLRQGSDRPDGEYEIIIECEVDGQSGNAEIAAAALTKLLPEADGGHRVTLDTYAIREQTTVTGDFALAVEVLRSFGETLRYNVE